MNEVFSAKEMKVMKWLNRLTPVICIIYVNENTEKEFRLQIFRSSCLDVCTVIIPP